MASDAAYIRQRAAKMVRQALRDGTLVKQSCEVCDSEDVQAHHPNYDRPLEVVWLCKEHHDEVHKALREGGAGFVSHAATPIPKLTPEQRAERHATYRPFWEAAAADGVELGCLRMRHITLRGHVDLPSGACRRAMVRICRNLAGDESALGASGRTSLPGDFWHRATGTFIELDRPLQFTQARLRTFSFYPRSVAFGFDLNEWAALCQRYADENSANELLYGRTRAFGAHGQHRRRAYLDALRDIGTAAVGLPPVLRALVVDEDSAAAWTSNREMFLRALNPS
jgi:hypothetical protein